MNNKRLIVQSACNRSLYRYHVTIVKGLIGARGMANNCGSKVKCRGDGGHRCHPFYKPHFCGKIGMILGG